MNRTLRILHLEDDPAYAELVRCLFQDHGLKAEVTLAGNREEFETSLAKGEYDVVLADYMLPGFNGIEALKRVRELTPDTPFLLVSGAIGEQTAIESTKAGATDYVLKLWPERLVPAVSRAVQEADERKRRQQSETQYRLIFDGNPSPMWVFDQETLEILEANDAALRHYGYTRSEFLSLTAKDLVLPDDVPAIIEYLHQRAQAEPNGTAGFAGMWRHRKKDGTRIDVEVRWHKIPFQGRAATLSMVNDVTERKRIEYRDAALLKLGQRLSSATSPSEAARIIKDVADELFDWDAFTLDLYSAEADCFAEVLNMDTDQEGRRFEIPVRGQPIKPSPMARRVIERGAELILRSAPLGMPEDVCPIGEVNRPSASLALVPIRDHTKATGILSVQSYSFRAYDQQDLATLQMLADHCGGALERMRAVQALRESEQRFRELFEGSPDAVFVEDLDGKVLDVNPAACQLHGLSREELIGRNVVDLTPPGSREKTLAEFRALVNGTSRQVEGGSQTRDGRTIPVEVRANRITYGGQAAVLLHVRDISERKGSEAALRTLEDQLRQSQKMEAIGQLAGGVAHDFNNILTVIHGHASLLVAGANLTGNAARSAHQIAQAAERAASLTRQLLAFSRRQVMQPRRLDLNEVVSNMTKMLGRLLGEDIALQLHYSQQPALIHADAGMMEQVLLNLAVNSRDAMPKGGVLTIRIGLAETNQDYLVKHSEGRVGKFIVLTVGDSGCGIAPENHRRIFEPFFTTKEVGKGTGLGLATVYGIIQQHQGWIEVESEAGKGATFRIYLPSSARPAEKTESNPADQVVRGGDETILVVEDEGPVRDLVCHLLSGYGYRILQAESGAKAIEIWDSIAQEVDLVLTDLVMPDRVNGRELAEKLRLKQPNLKVIFTSGYSADVVGKEFVLQQGLNYLQKPFHPRKLARVVRDCLDAVN